METINNRVSRLIYICSLPHSGSTAMSLFLGTHSRLIGLGGIDRAVTVLSDVLASQGGKKERKLQCTCGAPALECVYWGEIARQLPVRRPKDRPARYEMALEVFAAVFGSDRIPVDSSKHVEPLDDLARLPALDLKVLHLMKDVRSLTMSFIDNARRDKKSARPGSFLAIQYFLRWWRENGKIDNAVARHHLPALRAGYEEMCLAPEIILAAISAFLEIPAEVGSLDFSESASHLIVGNRMREQAEKQRLRYDHRWFARRDWTLASVIFPHIRRYNSKAVYSNGGDAMWSR